MAAARGFPYRGYLGDVTIGDVVVATSMWMTRSRMVFRAIVLGDLQLGLLIFEFSCAL